MEWGREDPLQTAVMGVVLLSYSAVQNWQDSDDAHFDLHSAVPAREPGWYFTIPTVFHFALKQR